MLWYLSQYMYTVKESVTTYHEVTSQLMYTVITHLSSHYKSSVSAYCQVINQLQVISQYVLSSPYSAASVFTTGLL